jgi:hypothetical protein
VRESAALYDVRTVCTRNVAVMLDLAKDPRHSFVTAIVSGSWLDERLFEHSQPIDLFYPKYFPTSVLPGLAFGSTSAGNLIGVQDFIVFARDAIRVGLDGSGIKLIVKMQ